ncbi:MULTISPECIES: COP23 domain-containing protein [Planktothricoides]|uniref:Uncharacterized protein n=1 Tax=Planktothricoides raciborskii FACHB-1370 TaxID=2949576 RepID=A0ABR8E6N9_9CYAN|nr:MULTISPECIES: COP23 domain-containing protein [Planktothricoides]KOR37259.1 hypothetical protein AM228_07425 [Planktothricoides sp. SR001]MBD2542411.1 hypothetical protein [Planktothricoides raciborskii FACHB-1370]MBD2582079.1 hypothetical protein [Planktothricoides raciborskii FACHB-1261]
MTFRGKLFTQLFAGLTGFTVAVATTVNLPTVAQQNRRFFCGTDFSPTHGTVPATIARTERGPVPMIHWVSDWIKDPKWTPQTRCEAVADRFQRYHDNGTLKYMRTGNSGNYPVICIADTKGGNCLQEDILVTLEPGTNADDVLQQMTDLRSRVGGGPIELNDDLFFYVDGEAYINMEVFLEQGRTNEELEELW